MKKAIVWLAPIASACVIALLLLSLAPTKDSPGRKAASPVHAHAISNIEEAKRFFIGTWTYTEPIDPDGPNSAYVWNWEKWVVKEDGTVDVYTAPPTADDWGKPQKQSYEIFTSKYVDTGKRFYALHMKDMFVSANILDDDLIALQVSRSDPVAMRRGDKNPFSK